MKSASLLCPLMRSLANPELNIITPVDFNPKPRRVIKRKKPHYRGSKSGLLGVIRVTNCPNRPWKAYMRKHGQYITIGYFATKCEASKAYCVAVSLPV